MTDDYWGPMPDDSEYPTPRERLDDGEADRLRALLRRWVVAWMSESAMHGGPKWWECRECGQRSNYSSRRIRHAGGCVVGDTLKELGK